ncbi:MAG TPA: 3-isopropylmalate dehydratase small subunit [Firmicutes bacterium]|nr:3-isopropylmalate dehydratase small subunit [Bacillota bacterium]
MVITGKTWIFGDNIDTDLIIPARYLSATDPQELAGYCLEDICPEFPRQVKPGDLIVAGNNFGCGSSREHAPLAIKGTGVSCVIARSFARIFYRNAINIGLPILECPEDLTELLAPGEELTLDLGQGLILDGRGRRYQAMPFPPFMQKIISDGGLIEHVRQRLNLSCR